MLISGGFLLLVLAELDFATLLGTLRSLALWPLPLAVCATFLGLLMMTQRLNVLLKPLGGDFPWWRLFRAQLLGFAANNVLPLRMGELIRIDYLARHGAVPHSSVFATVGIERLFDLLLLALLALGLLSVLLPLSGAARLAGTLGGLALAFGLLFCVARWPAFFARAAGRLAGLVSQRLGTFIADRAVLFANGLASLRSLGAWLRTLGASFAYWSSALVFCRLLLLTFGLRLPFYAPALVIVFVAMSGLLPSAPAYVGTYHYFAALALRTLGVDAAVAASFAIVMHVSALLPFTVVALLLLYREVFRRGEKPAQS